MSRSRPQPQQPRGLRCALAWSLLAAAGWTWTGCGGGSPADTVPPDDVELTLVPLGEPAPRSVGLVLGPRPSTGEVNLELVGAELEAATGVAFELRYDAAFLEFTGVGSAAFFGTDAVWGAEVVEAAPGRLVGVAATPDQTAGRGGSGPVLSLRFRLKQLRDGESSLTFGVPESLVYGPAGVAGQHVFVGAQLVTRIRPPT